jgi:hypothetical protein
MPDAVRDVSSTNDSTQGYSNRLLTGGSLDEAIPSEPDGPLAAHARRVEVRYRRRRGRPAGTCAPSSSKALSMKASPSTDAAYVTAATRVGTLPLSFLTLTIRRCSAVRARSTSCICLETLEHAEDVSAVLDEVVNLARPAGTILSPSRSSGTKVVVKQAGRWLANRGGSYSYERYTWRELWTAGARWKVDALERQNLHSHKGFDFRKVKKQVDDRVTIVGTAFSPASFLGPVLASTVYWLGTKRT